jgi:hypothetical protein
LSLWLEFNIVAGVCQTAHSAPISNATVSENTKGSKTYFEIWFKL